MFKILRNFLIGAYVFSPLHVLAVNADACTGAGGTVRGNECVVPGKGLFGTGSLFQLISNTLIFVVGAISVVMIIIGGLRYVLSGGNSSSVSGAKDTILYAVIGLVVSILAYAIVAFVLTRIGA